MERKEHFWAPSDEEDPKDPLETDEEGTEPCLGLVGGVLCADESYAGRLYISNADTVRLRVISLEWQEVEPLAPSIRDKLPPVDPTTGEFILPTEEELEMKRRERERDAGLRVTVSGSPGAETEKADPNRCTFFATPRHRWQNRVWGWSNGGQSRNARPSNVHVILASTEPHASDPFLVSATSTPTIREDLDAGRAERHERCD